MKRTLLVALALLTAGLAGCLDDPQLDSTASGQQADLVLEDGKLWTPGEQPGFASALAVRDSRIVHVGDEVPDDLLGEGTRVVDLDGASVYPGFRDHHMHPLRDRPLTPSYEPRSEVEQARADNENHAVQTAYHGQRHLQYEVGDYEGNAPTDYENCSPPDPDAVDEARERYEAFEAEAAAQGITTLVDAYMGNLTKMAALEQMEAEGDSKVRWLVRVAAGCYEHLDEMGIQPHEGDWVQWHGVKLYGDGFLGAWVAALAEPYSDRPGWDGILVHNEEALDHFLTEARERGLHVGTHAIGDATIRQTLDAYEEHMPEDGRWTVEHAQVTTREIVERFAEVGAVPSIQLSFATTDERMASDRLGDRVGHAYNWSGFVDAGVPVAGGSDYPIEVITPLWGLQRESTRQEVDGTPEGGFFPENGLALDEALASITWGSAYAAHEDERGKLEVGNHADLTVVREDLFAVDPHDIASATILMTVVNGEVVFEGETSYPPDAPSDGEEARDVGSPGVEGRTGADDPPAEDPRQPWLPAGVGG